MLSLVRVSVIVDDDLCCCCFCWRRPPPSLLLSMFPAVSLEVSVVVVEVYWIEFFASFMAVPERYEMKPGSIGRIHGDRKEASPAPAETKTLVSNTILFHTTLR